MQTGTHDPAILRRAQDRQHKINTARAIGELVADLLEFAHNCDSSEQIVGRATENAALRDITMIGTPGEDTLFDPAIHQLQWGTPTPGVPVFVMRPGYSFRYGNEVIVLQHALVATA